MRKFRVAEYARAWPVLRALLIVFVVCSVSCVLAYSNFVQVVHTDEATHSVLLSRWLDYGNGTTGDTKPTADGTYLAAIVAVARMVDPPPSLPDRAHEYLLRANSQLKAVKSPDDLRRLIVDYDSVVESAPWWGSAYYDRARAEAVAGLYLWAIADYERFLKLNPSPADAQDARARIAQLEGSN